MASLLEQGNLKPKRSVMKDIREQQDSGQQQVSNYPRTLKDRAERLLESTHCRDDEYVFKREGEENQNKNPI